MCYIDFVYCLYSLVVCLCLLNAVFCFDLLKIVLLVRCEYLYFCVCLSVNIIDVCNLRL